MPALLYACVSTEAQEKQQTIDSQVAELRRYAEAQGLTIDHEFIEDGHSGTMPERPGLDALRIPGNSGNSTPNSPPPPSHNYWRWL